MTVTGDEIAASIVALGLLGYLGFEVSTSLTKKKVEETVRRVLGVSVTYAVSAVALSLLYSGISSVIPAFQGAILIAVWIVSVVPLILKLRAIHQRALERLKLGEEEKLSLVERSFERLDSSLQPLAGAIAAAQASVSELSSKVDSSLAKGIAKLTAMTDATAKAIAAQTQSVASMNAKVERREVLFSEMVEDYNRWHEKRGSENEATLRLMSGTDSLLEKFGVICEQLDGYLDGLAENGRESLVEEGTDVNKRDGAEKPIVVQVAQTSAAETGAQAPAATGKLTKEAGIANRERGNTAQLQFSETVLRAAGKRHDYSLKEGQPDFIFRDTDTNSPKAVGAFKALSLYAIGTRQRWIPKRKLIAETRSSTKLSIPLILFVQNPTNGRIWAKVISAEEAKNFKGITTPVMLVESDPNSERMCRETLDMALKLL